MASILKVKDLDGNIYEIPAFKGRKGDDGLSVYTSTSTEFLDKSSFYMNISEINVPDNRVLQIDDLIFCPRLGKVYIVKEINKFNQARLNFLYNLKGEKGDSGVYVGSGEMPDGYNIQIDPDGEGSLLEYNTPQMFVTPQMFGAVGDNITDDTEAFKKCFEHTNIYIPSGKYLINDTIEVLPRTKVVGEGAFKSSIYSKAAVTFNVQEYASFADMAIYGNDENTGIAFPFKNLKLHNVRFRYLKYGVSSDAEAVLYNTFEDCAFLTVDYPLYFPNANPFNTCIISKCEFHSYDVVLTAPGTIYAINFDRCIFEGGEAGNCVVDTIECASMVFSSCYYENRGKLISDNVKRGNVIVRDTWIHEAGNVILSKKSPCILSVRFVDSTIVNSQKNGFLIDGTNLNVDIANCMTKDADDSTFIIPITTADIASQCGVATSCKINGGYLTLDTLPST